MNDGVQSTKIPELRKDYLILNSAGLNIVCRIGHELITEGKSAEEIVEYIDRLAQINWRKDTPIWQGNIVQEGATGLKISTSNSTIKQAVANVRQVIGLNKTKVEPN